MTCITYLDMMGLNRFLKKLLYLWTEKPFLDPDLGEPTQQNTPPHPIVSF